MDRNRTRNDKRRLDKTIGKNIRTARERRKMTRDELAELVDMTVSHLGLIERGERGATPVTLEKLVGAFDVSIDSLFAGVSNALSAREMRETTNGTFYKKVSALISYLTETELELLSHTIKGIIKTRQVNDAYEGNENDKIFSEIE